MPWDEIKLFAVLFVIAALLGLGILAVVQDQKQWEKYAADHHCHVVGKKDGQVGVGIGADGKTVTTISPDQDIWACDGGEIQIR